MKFLAFDYPLRIRHKQNSLYVFSTKYRFLYEIPDLYIEKTQTQKSYMADWIGYKWLENQYQVETVQPLPVSSCIGKGRSTTIKDGLTVETYGEATRPASTFAAHLTFALKREGVHLEFLARLFDQISPSVMSEWVNREPSGAYARRAGFFYEWLTGQTIDFSGVQVGNYVEALSQDHYLVASSSTNVARWRVRDNLPGTRDFCPLIRHTPRLNALENYDIAGQLSALEQQFGTDILQRSAVWLTIKESHASFAIEHEANQRDRIERFALAIEKWSGNSVNPLNLEFLNQIQTEILGQNALRRGIRESPVFVGEMRRGIPVVHYVAPHFEYIPALLEGLKESAKRTQGQSPLLRAAVLSFGFVYIHPMVDGNGRISRFLINDTLIRDKALPKPYILPISSTITSSVTHRVAYDEALEQFSRPFMARFRSSCRFGPVVTCADGVRTDFSFSSYHQARWTWAFPDLTAQSEYLSEVIRETVEIEMRGEADFLQRHKRLRERIKQVVEAPDVEIDRLIRSIRQNNGTISGKLASEFPFLAVPDVAQVIVKAILHEQE